MSENTAVLLVQDWTTVCSRCLYQVLPEAKTHVRIAGYGPPANGCGALFTGIASAEPGKFNDARLHEMRPDLKVVRL
jgi:hypothetical protein